MVRIGAEHYIIIYKSPHKDRSKRMCVCLCTWFTLLAASGVFQIMLLIALDWRFGKHHLKRWGGVWRIRRQNHQFRILTTAHPPNSTRYFVTMVTNERMRMVRMFPRLDQKCFPHAQSHLTAAALELRKHKQWKFTRLTRFDWELNT